MPDKELCEVAKLGNGEICCEGCLTAFFSYNSDTDIGSLNHGNIIATIANAGYPFLCVSANEEGDICLLGRRATTSDDSRKQHSKGNKCVLVVRKEVRK